MKTIIITLLFTQLLISPLIAQKLSQEDRKLNYALTHLIEGNILKYKSDHMLIERLDAKDFTYEDENIRIAIWPQTMEFYMRIYNKTNREMNCRWTKALWVIDGRSYEIIYMPKYGEYRYAVSAPPYIAPQAYEKHLITAAPTYIFNRRRVKKYGPLSIRLMIPIEVNGKEVVYDLKYKVSYWDWKKEEKERKREKKEKKEKTQ